MSLFASSEPLHTITGIDRNAGSQLELVLTERSPIHHRHLKVQKDHEGLGIGQSPQRLASVAGSRDRVTLGAQELRHQTTVVWIIVHDEYGPRNHAGFVAIFVPARGCTFCLTSPRLDQCEFRFRQRIPRGMSGT